MGNPKDIHRTPISQRPPHGPLFSKIFFPIFFTLAQIGINSAQICALPFLLVPFVGHRLFRSVIDWTKDGYGRLLILITVLFAPTSLVLTVDTPPSLNHLVERDANGRVTKVNLPDRLVVMANHQAYTDWMYTWILACYSGNAAGLVILLKASLKRIPVVGWGMVSLAFFLALDPLAAVRYTANGKQFFRFIFMQRNWAADRKNLAESLRTLGQDARGSDEPIPKGSGNAAHGETSELLPKVRPSGSRRSPLWLLIFPEGTITSDEERAKSVRYAQREEVADFVTLLHPRSTGILFCLRTLLPQVPDLQLLDLTIGYPGVPCGKYPQDYYGLNSVFFRSVPPPTVHVHMHLYDRLSSPDCEIPSLLSRDHPNYVPPTPAEAIEGDAAKMVEGVPKDEPGVPTPAEARKFELWLRGVWEQKERRLIKFCDDMEDQKFVGEGGVEAREVVKIRQIKWYHWISAFGGGGFGTLAAVSVAIWGLVAGIRR